MEFGNWEEPTMIPDPRHLTNGRFIPSAAVGNYRANANEVP